MTDGEGGWAAAETDVQGDGNVVGVGTTAHRGRVRMEEERGGTREGCLLYTSDAADE